MSLLCAATTLSGRPCKAQASRWPRGIDGDPQLCGRHIPANLREIRDAAFAEQERRHVERLAALDPVCWSWPAALDWEGVAEYYSGTADDLQHRFEQDEEHALYMVLVAWHNDRCAVCGLPDPRMVRDHDHNTGTVRGLLCRSCNGLEPHDDGLFQKYRSNPPVEILGIHLRYYSQRNGWAEPRPIIQRRLDNHPAYQLAAKLGERLQKDDDS
ncbi:endonuclease domain-containing protein [Streptomyces sp. NPDC058398]|uniref:endonuclease domain-containing protein n=1 Tax=Streptomyces sp. NPDC058398 TaxID=3346479 RepID=UPI00365F0A88